jgi:pimeloyl-ACP methyl ester carboxylesterase
MKEKIKKPSVFLHLTEVFRASYEWIRGALFLNGVSQQNIGKGQVVLVIPGLVSTDVLTVVLRKYLQKLGYNVFGWEMGLNLGRLESVHGLVQKVEKMAQEHQQKIVVIGWSMGGIFAREVAKTTPNSVKQVMTIGSPFADILAPNWAKRVFDVLNRGIEIDQTVLAQLHEPAPVPTTAFYSKLDGIVPWQACREIVENDTHKNVEISSSHLGMGANPSVIKTIAANLI